MRWGGGSIACIDSARVDPSSLLSIYILISQRNSRLYIGPREGGRGVEKSEGERRRRRRRSSRLFSSRDPLENLRPTVSTLPTIHHQYTKLLRLPAPSKPKRTRTGSSQVGRKGGEAEGAELSSRVEGPSIERENDRSRG